VKRLADVLIVLAAAPLWLPLAAVVALVALVAQRRPLFYVDERTGKDGRPFRLVKFRTMRIGDAPDAERLTVFGRFLRSTSLDELPQLWNVLKGDMSLVGPRPLPVRYLPRYTPEQNRRHEVRPGITGWAQIHGRNALDWEDKFRYDVDYVNHQSLWLDTKILAATVWQVVSRRGISHSGDATMPEFQPGLIAS